MTTAHSPIAPDQSAASSAQEATASKRVFGASGLIVTPIAFAIALIVALSAGWQNALLLAVIFAGFAAVFFYGLSWLATAVRRDERRALNASGARRRMRGSRTA